MFSLSIVSNRSPCRWISLVFVIATFGATKIADSFALVPATVRRGTGATKTSARWGTGVPLSEQNSSDAVPEKYRSNKPFVNQATIQFNNQLNKMARNFDKHSARTVEETLRQTLRDIQLGLELEIQPNVVSFVACINAWARSRRPDAAERAEKILQWMLSLSSIPVTEFVVSHEEKEIYRCEEDEVDLADVLFIKPNCIAFNAAITAWIRSSSKEAHNNAERLMDQLWDLYLASGKDPELKPNARTFNLVINAIARSREPNCGDRAAALLSRMEELFTAGDTEMQPEAQMFGAIINAHANDSPNDPQATDKAAQILAQMNSMHQLGYVNVKPNTFVYNACLNAFSKSEGNADQAMQLLDIMEEQFAKGDLSLKPDVVSYTTCISALANSPSSDSGEMADALLNRMMERYLLEGDKETKPNSVTYLAAVRAWMAAASASKNDEGRTSHVMTKAAESCQNLIMNMCMQYLAGDGDQKPTKTTFDLVQEALMAAGEVESADKISILKRRILEYKLPRRETI